MWVGGCVEGGVDSVKKEEEKKKSGLHTHPFFPFSCSISLLGVCFVPPPLVLLLLLSDKCHSSLSLAATMDDLFRRDERGGERKRDEREGGMKRKNGCLLTCASERQENKAAVTKARVLFSSLFSLLCEGHSCVIGLFIHLI